MAATEPCSTCPWRKTSTVGGADIPRFDIKLMRGLANTVPQGREQRDGFRPIMACHYSGETCRPCVGYLAIEGYTNINVRLMASQGEVDLSAIWDAAEALDLWPSFHEMLAAYEAEQEAS